MTLLKQGLPVLLALTLAGQMVVATAQAGEVTGKVVAIFHEKVKLPNNTWEDKISATVANCKAGNQFVTVNYPPSRVSEDNHAEFLFRNLGTAARSTEQMNQYMNVVSGHATIQFDDNTKTVQKTTFWGHNWACGQNVEGTKAAGMSPGGSPTMATPTSTPAANQPKPSGGNPLRGLPSVPGVPSIPRFGF